MRLLPAGILILLASCLPYKSGAEEPKRGNFPLITRRIQSWVDRGFYPGCSLWIAKGNQVLYQKSFGTHNPDTEVYIASAGKWLAAATVMAVVDEGKLSLDDPAGKWLPELATDPKGKATLRQMLAHTSGYPPYQPEGNPSDDYQTTAESVKHLIPLPPKFSPGQQFDYGGLAMQVAGRMAELATGEDWETLFQKRIGRPLGMTHTHFTPVDPGHIPMIAGGAVSSLHDYSRFLTMIANNGVFEGKKVLSATSIAQMQADQVGNAYVKREEFVERVRGNTHRGIYGLGEWREELDPKGNATLSSSPSWAGTYPWIDKTLDIRAVFMAHVDVGAANQSHFSGFWTSPVLAKMVRADLNWDHADDLPNFEQGIIPAKEGDLVYEAAGSGEPLVLIHGHSFDRRMWNPQFAALAKKFRVIRYDLRGYGLSDMPVEGKPFSHPEDLLALMDHLKIQKAHIVGLSLGGFVVTDFLALHPERILTATIASSGLYTGPGSGKALEGEALSARLKEIEQLRKSGIEEFKKQWQEGLLRGSSRPEIIRPLLGSMIGEWSAWQPLHVEPPHLLGRGVLDLLSENKPQVPVLFLTGANDKGANAAIPPLAQVLPSAKHVILPDAGHLANLDQPDAFQSAVINFITEPQHQIHLKGLK